MKTGEKMLNIAVCGDDPIFCTRMEECILRLCADRVREVALYFSGEDFCAKLYGGAQYDLVFLDADLKTMPGIDVGRVIRFARNDFDTQIVWISGKESGGAALFGIQPLDYLVKPVRPAQILRVLSVYERMTEKRARFFDFVERRQPARVPAAEILYFESRLKKILLVCSRASYEFYGNISDAAQTLQSDSFVMIHRSYLVNFDHVVQYGADCVTMDNGERLPVSRQNRKKVRCWLMRQRENGQENGLFLLKRRD